jgi:hypothetical protein
MDDSRFWAMIETAWHTVGGKVKMRHELSAGSLCEENAYELLKSLEAVIPALREELELLSAADLLAFDQILERKLYDIDRAEIHEHTDGSDDGFLFARGFIVAVGKTYYDAVNAKPSFALTDFECEAMCYLSFHVHEEKFGAVPTSPISRESQSNGAGWR